METRKYQVKNMRAGLERIKSELGSNAVILSTTRLSSEGEEELLEITVGIAQETPPTPPTPPSASLSSETPDTSGASPDVAALSEIVTSTLRELTEQMKDLQSEMRHIRLKEEWSRTFQDSSKAPQNNTAQQSASTALPKELSDGIRHGLARLQRGKKDDEFAGTISALYGQLIDSGMLSRDVEEMIAFAFSSDVDWESNPALLFGLVEKEISKHIDTMPPLWHQRSQECEVAVLVGPTGIGKTTTLAKIAAHCRFIGHKNVAVICADTFRIGGVYQLESYAELIGLPMATATTVRELAHALEEFRSCDLVLIDTTGNNPWSDADANSIRFEDYRKLPEYYDVRFHLCLSATTRTEDLVTMVERYRVIEPTSLIFTKIDEAQNLGCILSTCRAASIPISHVCHGQAVPEDITCPTPTEIARWICEGTTKARTALHKT